MKSRDEIFQEICAAGPGAGERTCTIVFLVLTLIGIVVFLAGVSGSEAQRAWQAYLINFHFWSDVAFGTVLLSATLTMTNARWGRSVKRLAEAPVAFLPVAFVLFWGLYFGKERLFPWIQEPVHEKAAWLNVPFLFARDGASLFVLVAVAVALVYASVGRDMKLLAAGSEKWGTGEAPGEGPTRLQTILAPAYGVLYAVLLSLIAFDLIMSLSPHWSSTLFGAYYWIGCFYMGLAGVIILSVIAERSMGLRGFIHDQQYHDLGKLLMGFCIVAGDFFYAQFLVIWYGNLPEETRFVIKRTMSSPWAPVAWTVLVVCYALPFVLLLSRKIKMKRNPMLALTIMILCGMWIERFLLIVPSLWKGAQVPLGLMELCISAGFLGIMALCVLQFLKRFPLLPIADLLFQESLGIRQVVEDEEGEG